MNETMSNVQSIDISFKYGGEMILEFGDLPYHKFRISFFDLNTSRIFVLARLSFLHFANHLIKGIFRPANEIYE